MSMKQRSDFWEIKTSGIHKEMNMKLRKFKIL
jgi:hypothetical protein